MASDYDPLVRTLQSESEGDLVLPWCSAADSDHARGKLYLGQVISVEPQVSPKEEGATREDGGDETEEGRALEAGEGEEEKEEGTPSSSSSVARLQSSPILSQSIEWSPIPLIENGARACVSSFHLGQTKVSAESLNSTAAAESLDDIYGDDSNKDEVRRMSRNEGNVNLLKEEDSRIPSAFVQLVGFPSDGNELDSFADADSLVSKKESHGMVKGEELKDEKEEKRDSGQNIGPAGCDDMNRLDNVGQYLNNQNDAMLLDICEKLDISLERDDPYTFDDVCETYNNDKQCIGAGLSETRFLGSVNEEGEELPADTGDAKEIEEFLKRDDSITTAGGGTPSSLDALDECLVVLEDEENEEDGLNTSLDGTGEGQVDVDSCRRLPPSSPPPPPPPSSSSPFPVIAELTTQDAGFFGPISLLWGVTENEGRTAKDEEEEEMKDEEVDVDRTKKQKEKVDDREEDARIGGSVEVGVQALIVSSQYVPGISASGIDASDISASGINSSCISSFGINAFGISASDINASGINSTGINASDISTSPVEESDMNEKSIPTESQDRGLIDYPTNNTGMMAVNDEETDECIPLEDKHQSLEVSKEEIRGNEECIGSDGMRNDGNDLEDENKEEMPIDVQTIVDCETDIKQPAENVFIDETFQVHTENLFDFVDGVGYFEGGEEVEKMAKEEKKEEEEEVMVKVKEVGEEEEEILENIKVEEEEQEENEQEEQEKEDEDENGESGQQNVDEQEIAKEDKEKYRENIAQEEARRIDYEKEEEENLEAAEVDDEEKQINVEVKENQENTEQNEVENQNSEELEEYEENIEQEKVKQVNKEEVKEQIDEQEVEVNEENAEEPVNDDDENAEQIKAEQFNDEENAKLLKVEEQIIDDGDEENKENAEQLELEEQVNNGEEKEDNAEQLEVEEQVNVDDDENEENGEQLEVEEQLNVGDNENKDNVEQLEVERQDIEENKDNSEEMEEEEKVNEDEDENKENTEQLKVEEQVRDDDEKNKEMAEQLVVEEQHNNDVDEEIKENAEQLVVEEQIDNGEEEENKENVEQLVVESEINNDNDENKENTEQSETEEQDNEKEAEEREKNAEKRYRNKQVQVDGSEGNVEQEEEKEQIIEDLKEENEEESGENEEITKQEIDQQFNEENFGENAECEQEEEMRKVDEKNHNDSEQNSSQLKQEALMYTSQSLDDESDVQNYNVDISNAAHSQNILQDVVLDDKDKDVTVSLLGYLDGGDAVSDAILNSDEHSGVSHSESTMADHDRMTPPHTHYSDVISFPSSGVLHKSTLDASSLLTESVGTGGATFGSFVDLDETPLVSVDGPDEKENASDCSLLTDSEPKVSPKAPCDDQDPNGAVASQYSGVLNVRVLPHFNELLRSRNSSTLTLKDRSSFLAELLQTEDRQDPIDDNSLRGFPCLKASERTISTDIDRPDSSSRQDSDLKGEVVSSSVTECKESVHEAGEKEKVHEFYSDFDKVNISDNSLIFKGCSEEHLLSPPLNESEPSCEVTSNVRDILFYELDNSSSVDNHKQQVQILPSLSVDNQYKEYDNRENFEVLSCSPVKSLILSITEQPSKETDSNSQKVSQCCFDNFSGESERKEFLGLSSLEEDGNKDQGENFLGSAKEGYFGTQIEAALSFDHLEGDDTHLSIDCQDLSGKSEKDEQVDIPRCFIGEVYEGNTGEVENCLSLNEVLKDSSEENVIESGSAERLSEVDGTEEESICVPCLPVKAHEDDDDEDTPPSFSDEDELVSSVITVIAVDGTEEESICVPCLPVKAHEDDDDEDTPPSFSDEDELVSSVITVIAVDQCEWVNEEIEDVDESISSGNEKSNTNDSVLTGITECQTHDIHPVTDEKNIDISIADEDINFDLVLPSAKDDISNNNLEFLTTGKEDFSDTALDFCLPSVKGISSYSFSQEEDHYHHPECFSLGNENEALRQVSDIDADKTDCTLGLAKDVFPVIQEHLDRTNVPSNPTSESRNYFDSHNLVVKEVETGLYGSAILSDISVKKNISDLSREKERFYVIEENTESSSPVLQEKEIKDSVSLFENENSDHLRGLIEVDINRLSTEKCAVIDSGLPVIADDLHVKLPVDPEVPSIPFVIESGVECIPKLLEDHIDSIPAGIDDQIDILPLVIYDDPLIGARKIVEEELNSCGTLLEDEHRTCDIRLPLIETDIDDKCSGLVRESAEDPDFIVKEREDTHQESSNQDHQAPCEFDFDYNDSAVEHVSDSVIDLCLDSGETTFECKDRFVLDPNDTAPPVVESDGELPHAVPSVISCDEESLNLVSSPCLERDEVSSRESNEILDDKSVSLVVVEGEVELQETSESIPSEEERSGEEEESYLCPSVIGEGVHGIDFIAGVIGVVKEGWQSLPCVAVEGKHPSFESYLSVIEEEDQIDSVPPVIGIDLDQADSCPPERVKEVVVVGEKPPLDGKRERVREEESNDQVEGNDDCISESVSVVTPSAPGECLGCVELQVEGRGGINSKLRTDEDISAAEEEEEEEEGGVGFEVPPSLAVEEEVELREDKDKEEEYSCKERQFLPPLLEDSRANGNDPDEISEFNDARVGEEEVDDVSEGEGVTSAGEALLSVTKEGLGSVSSLGRVQGLRPLEETTTTTNTSQKELLEVNIKREKEDSVVVSFLSSNESLENEELGISVDGVMRFDETSVESRVDSDEDDEQITEETLEEEKSPSSSYSSCVSLEEAFPSSSSEVCFGDSTFQGTSAGRSSMTRGGGDMSESRVIRDSGMSYLSEGDASDDDTLVGRSSDGDGMIISSSSSEEGTAAVSGGDSANDGTLPAGGEGTAFNKCHRREDSGVVMGSSPGETSTQGQKRHMDPPSPTYSHEESEDRTLQALHLHHQYIKDEVSTPRQRRSVHFGHLDDSECLTEPEDNTSRTLERGMSPATDQEGEEEEGNAFFKFRRNRNHQFRMARRFSGARMVKKMKKVVHFGKKSTAEDNGNHPHHTKVQDSIEGQSFGKRSGGGGRRANECLILEPSEMIVIDYPDVQLMRPGQRASCNTMNLEKLMALEQDEYTNRPGGRGAPPPPPTHIHAHQYENEAIHAQHHHHHESYLPDLVGSSMLRGARSRGSVGSSVRDGSDTSSAYSGSDTMCHSLHSSLEPDDVDLSGLTESAVDSDEEDLAESIESLAVRDCVRECLEKDPTERTEDDIEVLLEFTQRLTAFANMMLVVRRAMCQSMVFAVVEDAGTVLMNHGEELDSWSVIINGHVEVTHLDGNVHELHLGDCFGITPTTEKLYHQGVMRSKVDDCQFVCIRQADYYRILHQGEENTRRIEEDGIVVLVTEQRPIDGGNRKGNIVIKGTSERLMCQLVEVENNVDPTYVEDFLLTHRTFVETPLNVANKLLQWFDDPSLRDRVTRVVLLWVNNHFTDFEMDLVMMNFLEQFEEGLEREKMAGQLRLLDFACATKARARVVTLTRPSRDEILHFSILGGYERGHGIFISKVEKGSKAEEVGLKRGDQILEVNGQSFDHMNHARALEILRQPCHLSITVKSNLLAFKEMLSTPENSPRPHVRKTSDVRGLSADGNGHLPMNNFAGVNMPSDHTQQSPRDKGKEDKNKGSFMTLGASTAKQFKKKIINSFVPKPAAPESQMNSDESVSSQSSVGGGLYHSHSNPDLSTAGTYEDVRAEFPEHVLKVYRATDHNARFLPVHKETTAREVVMLALQIFNINDPSGSSNYALYEVTVTEEGITKQRRLPDSLQNLAERIGLSSRYYLKNITVSQTLVPDDIVNELVRESAVCFLQLNSVELAVQLTLEDYTIFRQIEPTEYIDYLFKLKSNYGTPALNQFADLVNREMFWVVTEVCSEHNLVKRSKTVKQFIKVARQCKECKNFNSMFAILSGLNHGAVSRLKQTWERLPSKYSRMFHDMQDLMDPSRNMSKYRNLVQNENIQSPIIPFYPVVARDLTFTHEGNDDKVEGLINFEKLRMISRYIRDLQNMCSAPYDLFNIQDAGGQAPSSALISLNQMAAAGGHQIATVKRRKKSTAAPDKKKMYEEAQMVRRVKAYLARLQVVTDEEQLRNMSMECEGGPEGHKSGSSSSGQQPHNNGNNGGSSSAPPTNPPPRRRPQSPTPSTTSSTSSTSQTSDGKKQTAKFGATSPQSISKMKALAEPKTKPHHGPRSNNTHHSLSPSPSPGPPRKGPVTNHNTRSNHERSHSDTHAVPVDLSAESSSVTSLSKLHKSHTSGSVASNECQVVPGESDSGISTHFDCHSSSSLEVGGVNSHECYYNHSSPPAHHRRYSHQPESRSRPPFPHAIAVLPPVPQTAQAQHNVSAIRQHWVCNSRARRAAPGVPPDYAATQLRMKQMGRALSHDGVQYYHHPHHDDEEDDAQVSAV